MRWLRPLILLCVASVLCELPGVGALDTAAGAERGFLDQPRSLTLPLMRKAPVLDGRLAEGEWAAAASLPCLIDAGKPGASLDYPRQEIRFAYDASNLYMALRAHFPLNATLIKWSRMRCILSSAVANADTTFSFCSEISTIIIPSPS